MTEESTSQESAMLKMTLPQFIAGYRDGREFYIINPARNELDDTKLLAALKEIYEASFDDPTSTQHQVGMLLGRISGHAIPIQESEFADEHERRDFHMEKLLGAFGKTMGGKMFEQYILMGWILYEELEQTMQMFREKIMKMGEESA